MLAAALIVFGVPVFAQQGPSPGQMGGQFDDDMGLEAGPGRGGPGGPPSEERREEIRKKVEAIRIWRLTEELKLDSQASAKVAALLGSLDNQRAALMRESQENMRALREQLTPSGKPDERKLKTILEKLERNHHEMMELREREWKGMKEILSVEQQARYVIFQREFMREIRNRIAGARGGPGQGRGGMGPGGGPGYGRSPQ
jgi:Spy/CpxP family protein refolding chaperone